MPADPASTRRSYDTVSRRYAVEVGGELPDKPLDRTLLEAFAELTAGSLVLDVGGGPGHVAAYLRDRGARPVSLDLSPGMAAIARATTGLPGCAADMTRLPVAPGSVGGVVCFYAVIHLDAAGRAMAYAEFARVLEPGGRCLIAFHVEDSETTAGSARTLTSWWEHDVDLTFRFLDPTAEAQALEEAGLTVEATLVRRPGASEHPSRRGYLLAQKDPTPGTP
jgi:SAM-dependent methyltransferase